MIPWIFLGLLLSIPLFFGYSFIPSDLLMLIEPWARPLLPGELTNHYFPDAIGETYPWKLLFSDFIKQGIWPVWNPYNQFGSPFLAISTQQPFDPFNILYFFLPTHWAFDIILILKIIFSGYFMSLLLSFYQVSSIGRLIGGFCYALSGAMVLNAPFCWMQGAFVWLPLIVLHLEKIRLHSKTSSMGYASLFLGFSFLGGSLQTGAQLAFFLLLWFCSTQFSMKVLLAIGLGILIGSISLLPTMELVYIGGSRGFEASTWFNDIGNNLAKIPFAIAFFFPHFFGHLSIFNLITFFGKNWSDIIQGFVGLIPFCLCIIAMIKLSKIAIIRQYKFIALATLLTLFLTPLHEWFYLRGLIIWCFSAAVMAGICIRELENNNTHLEQAFLKLKKITGWGFLIFVLGLGFIHYFLAYFKEPFLAFGKTTIQNKIIHFGGLKPFYLEKIANTLSYYSFTQPQLLFSLLLLLLLYLGFRFLATTKSKRKILVHLLLYLTLVDLLYFLYNYMPIVNLKKYPLYPETPAIQFLKKDPEKFRIIQMSQENGQENPIFFLASNASWGIESVQQQTSLHYIAASRFQEQLLTGSGENPFNPTLANFANVKYILTNSVMLDSIRYPLVYQGEINIFLNLGAKPRAFFPTQWEEVINEEDAFTKLKKNSSINGSDFVYLQGNPNLSKNLGQSKKLATMSHYSPLKVILKTETLEDQLLVLTDAYYPGWKATIDGEKTTIYRANALFRAIEVPAGIHEIRFQFEPFSFYLGLWITITGILIAIFLILRENLKIVSGLIK